MKHAAAILCSLAVALLLSACSADGRAARTADAPPTDFTLALTVLTPASAHENPKVERWGRPARYVMEADWILRAAFGPVADDDTFPRQTRQLTQDQARRLWRDLRDSELLDPGHPARVGVWREEDTDTISGDTMPRRRQTDFILAYSVNGDRRTYAVGPDASPDARAAVRRLADSLAELAWVE